MPPTDSDRAQYLEDQGPSISGRRKRCQSCLDARASARQAAISASATQDVEQARHEFSDVAKLAAGGDELELGRTDRAGPTLECCRQGRGQHGTFIQQAKHADPGGHVEHRDHVEGIARAPRCACLTLPRELDPKRAEFFLDVSITASQVRQREREVARPRTC